MKQLKSFATFLMVVLCVLLVTSCNKEDNGVSQNDKEGNGDPQSVKRLIKVYNIINYSEGEYEKIANFYYNDGKLSEIANHYYYNYNNSTYTYNDVITYTYIGKIVLIEEGSGKYVLQLNSDGFVESGTYNTAKLDFEYSNGYLTKHTYSYQNDTTAIIDIKYDSKGNIMNMSYDLPKWLKREYTFTSSSYPSKGKSICLISIEGDEGYTILSPIYYAGLLGKDPTNLVSKIEEWKGGNYNSFKTLDYLLYDDGYINKMTRTQGSNPLGYSFFFLYE